MELTDSGLTNEALDLIAAEDVAQREKWGDQTHSIYKWVLILSEEVGELSKAVLESYHSDLCLRDIVKEAVQVATVALKIAWMASKRKGKRK